ncbi:hypothetical protein MXD59_21430 [Frankia sp. Ag45/Mut15]|uniref:Flp pilus-assembly TadG-like N-terminal domain-containing protein n=1 Tax=Frankia umida TaxID=573489 RepID=A0ABT0K3I5_9ACTN|nr:hypothetical protein [Frankia umida]MCK9878301.1 hypothetical protein [Frankia umida]
MTARPRHQAGRRCRWLTRRLDSLGRRLTQVDGHSGDDAGSITLFMLGALFVAAVLFAALLSDQVRVLHANGQAFDLAGKAARVGAQQLDPAALDTGTIRLDPATARTATLAYLDAHGIHDAQVTVTGAAVTVTVHQPVLFHIPVLTAGSRATVTQTRSAIATPGP